MDTIYWQKQTNTSLFPDLEWNKPERKAQAGHVLVIGGHEHALNAPAQAYELLKSQGVGEVRVVLPNKTKRLVQAFLPQALYLPSTPSGELAQDGFNELMEYSQWADTILLTGDSGRNSQTAIVFEQLVKAYTGNIVVTRDSMELLHTASQALLQRPATTLVLAFGQLQKLVKQIGHPMPLVSSIDLPRLVSFMHNLSTEYPTAFVTLHQNQLICAANGSVSTTKLNQDAEPKHWRLPLSTFVAGYQTWNPTKPFEALTHSAYTYAEYLKAQN